MSAAVKIEYTTPVDANILLPITEVHENDDESNSIIESWTLFVAVVLGVLVVALACTCVVVGLVRFKSSKSKNKKTPSAKIVYSGKPANDDLCAKFSSISNNIYESKSEYRKYK